AVLGRPRTIALSVGSAAAVVLAIGLVSQPASPPPILADTPTVEVPIEGVEPEPAPAHFHVPAEWCGNAYPEGWWPGDPSSLDDEDRDPESRILPAPPK